MKTSTLLKITNKKPKVTAEAYFVGDLDTGESNFRKKQRL